MPAVRLLTGSAARSVRSTEARKQLRRLLEAVRGPSSSGTAVILERGLGFHSLPLRMLRALAAFGFLKSPIGLERVTRCPARAQAAHAVVLLSFRVLSGQVSQTRQDRPSTMSVASGC